MADKEWVVDVSSVYGIDEKLPPIYVTTILM